MTAIELATRGSPLALLQAGMVASALRALGYRCENVVVHSTGDLRLDVPIHTLGGQGVFVKEIDEAVLQGRAAIAVHSAKDLPSLTDERLILAAYLERADPRDAIVGLALPELPAGARIATGSVRRRAQLAWLRPDLTFEDLRGNIASRLNKVTKGAAGDTGPHAVLVAMAALDRLELSQRAAYVFPTMEMLPQVGQGAVALCCRRDDLRTCELLSRIDHAPTRRTVDAERAWLRAIGGGCDQPVAAHCVALGPDLNLEAMIASPDGHFLVRAAARGTSPAELGKALAEEILDRGGRSLAK